MTITVEVTRDTDEPCDVYDAFAGWLVMQTQEFADMLELPAGTIVVTVRKMPAKSEVTT